MDRLLNRSLTMVAQAVGAAQGMILAMEPSSEQLRSRAHFGWPRSLDGDVSIQEPNQGLAQWAVQERESLIVDDVQLDPRWLHLSEVDDLPRAALIGFASAHDGRGAPGNLLNDSQGDLPTQSRKE